MTEQLQLDNGLIRISDDVVSKIAGLAPGNPRYCGHVRWIVRGLG